MPSGGKRPGAGRPRGAQNRVPISAARERKERERLRIERQAEARQLRRQDVPEAEIIQRVAARKLAKEVGEDFLVLFAGLAAKYQPLELAEDEKPPPGRTPDMALFDKYSKMSVDLIAILMPFQSARLSAVMMAPAPPPVAEEEKRRFTLTIFEGGKPVKSVA